MPIICVVHDTFGMLQYRKSNRKTFVHAENAARRVNESEVVVDMLGAAELRTGNGVDELLLREGELHRLVISENNKIFYSCMHACMERGVHVPDLFNELPEDRGDLRKEGNVISREG